MVRNRVLALLVPIFIFLASAEADTAGLVNDGVKAYQAQDYVEAAASFETALRSGHNNGYVWYNLGNAYYRLGKIGKSIAAYRRALNQFPADADIRANLSFARKQVKDQIDPAPTVIESMLRVLPPVSQQAYEKLFLLIYALGWGLLVVYILSGSGPAKKSAYALLASSVLLALLAFAVRPGFGDLPQLALTPSARALHPGVITGAETKIYSGDSESYQVVFLLHDGAEVMLGERRGGWQEILLPDGRKGWLQSSEVDTV